MQNLTLDFTNIQSLPQCIQQIGVLIQKLLDPVYNIQNHRRTEGIFGAAGQQIARYDPVVGDGLLMKRLLMPEEPVKGLAGINVTYNRVVQQILCCS